MGFNRNYSSYFHLTIICFLFFSCYTKKQISVSAALTATSEEWVVTTTHGKFGLQKAAFGTYSLAALQKLDSPMLKQNTMKFFSVLYPGRRDQSKKRKIYELTILGGNDTANVLLVLWQNETETQPGIFTKLVDKNANATVEKWKNAEGMISATTFGSAWMFKAGPYTGSWSDANPYLVTEGTLQNENELFNIQPVKQFTNSNAGPVTKGLLVIDSNGNELAAVQLWGKQKVWMKKTLSADRKLVIASVFFTILSSWEK